MNKPTKLIGLGKPVHKICDDECEKRDYEERCNHCNSDLKGNDCYDCPNKECDGTTFIGYKGPE